MSKSKPKSAQTAKHGSLEALAFELKHKNRFRGPIVDQYGALFGEMVRQGYLIEEQVFVGPVDATIYKTSREFDGGLFTTQELAILGKVAEFVNNFDTADKLSRYSHNEKLWIENDDGHPLSYLDAYELNGLERFIEA